MVELLGMLDSILNQQTHFCSCGQEHVRKTQIIDVSSGAFLRLPEYVKSQIVAGRIGLVFDEAVEHISAPIQTDLMALGFKISKICFKKGVKVCQENIDMVARAPQEIRLFVAIGTGAICDIVKSACAVRDAKFTLALTAPSTDNLLFDYTEMWQNGEKITLKAVPPCAVFVDLDIVLRAPKALISAGYGCLISKYAALFDRGILALSAGVGMCEQFECQMRDVLDNLFIQGGTIEDLTKTILAVSLLQQMHGEPNVLQGMEHIFACVLREWQPQKQQLLLGEHKFIATFTLMQYYSLVINYQGVDLLVPANKSQSASALAKGIGAPLAGTVLALQTKDEDIFQKTGYILDEYRTDFATQAHDVVQLINATCRTFRRIYDDAGFFLKNYLPSEKILQIMSHSTVLADKYYLLNYCKDSGYL